MTHTIYRNFLGRWFGKVTQVVISDAGLTLVDLSQNPKDIPIDQLIDFPIIKKSFFGNTLVIKARTQKRNTVARIWGISDCSVKVFNNEIKASLNQNIGENITRQLDCFYKEAIFQFLRDSSIEQLHEKVTPLIQSYHASKALWRITLSKEQLSKVDVISRMPVIKEAEKYRQYYENKLLDGQSTFFDGIESNPLTKDQRLAVIRNNDKNLILAAAGTGKTSVMVAKALHLISHDKVPADKVLVLAYNNAAAKELKERLEARKTAFGLSCDSPTIMTFHALGLQILKGAKTNTALSVFSQNTAELERWFSAWLLDHISQSDSDMKQFIELAYQPSDPFEFTIKEEYEAHIRDNEYRTLKGDKVKGYQVYLIANWLFLNSVDYEYDATYAFKRRVGEGFDYKPNFHIKTTASSSEIYLEYFDVTRDGSTPTCIDAKQYHEQINAKRKLHEECNTRLIEAYHDDFLEGNLAATLTNLMAKCDIKLVPLCLRDTLDAVIASGMLADNIKRYLKCLQAIRVEQLNNAQVEKRLNSANVYNAKAYAKLLHNIVEAYTSALLNEKAIDFDDMITNAHDHINNRKFMPQWTDILVDEFQDISVARMNLLNQLIDKGPRPRLTVVGDDWQSIYRFSGGKLALITQFEKFSGKHSLTTLQKTFRYNNSIANTAGKFVMQNPEQYKKQIEAHHQVDQAQVYLFDSDKSNLNQRIAQIVKNIRVSDPTGTIAILARYRYLLNSAQEKLSSLSDNSEIKYWTLHGAKGLEADYCIIIGLYNGKAGFPNQNKEDILVEALLPLVDGFKNSEERRLFYVAMTRAKKKAFLIADAMAPSEFIEELLSSDYDLQVMSEKFDTSYKAKFKCSSCESGYFTLKTGKFNNFYQCTSQAACHVKPRVCSQCSSPSIDGKTVSLCQNPHCQEKLKLCIKCGRPMKLRVGQHGDFWGCSGYAVKEDQCSYTEKL
jgi:DNA helicase-4